jgi:hypothetical protein
MAPYLQSIPLGPHDRQLAVSFLQAGPQLPRCLHILCMLHCRPADGSLQLPLQLLQLLLVPTSLPGCCCSSLVLLVLQLLLQTGDL